MTLSIGKLLAVLAIAAIIFGYKKLPELGKGLGESIRNFKKGLEEPETIDISPATEEKNTAQTASAQGSLSGDDGRQQAAAPRKKPAPAHRPMPGKPR